MSQYDEVRTKLRHAEMHIERLKEEDGIGHVSDVLDDLRAAIAAVYDIVEGLAES